MAEKSADRDEGVDVPTRDGTNGVDKERDGDSIYKGTKECGE